MTLPFFCFLLVYCLETLTLTLPFFILLVYCLVSAFRVFSLSFCAGLPCCCPVLYCVCVRGGGVRSPGEVGMLVHPPLGKCVKALCVIVLMVAQHCTQLGSLALKQKNTGSRGDVFIRISKPIENL